MLKSKKKVKAQARPTITHYVGQKHFIQGTECVVRFVNNGMAWVCPTSDDSDVTSSIVGLACAKIDEHGKVTLI